jgi:hypothetical protein
MEGTEVSLGISYKLKRNARHLFLRLQLQISGSYAKRPSVSICTCIKGRFSHLKETFLKNLADNKDYSNCEFLILNYNCPDPRTEKWVKVDLMPYIDAGIVNYYHFPDGNYFHRAHARNLAFRLAKGKILCNVDADNFTGKRFASYLAALLTNDNNSFVCGPRDGRGLGGRIGVLRQHWELVGGFDERFESYGPEDIDFANRLCMTGLRKKMILFEGFCHTISHSNQLRYRHHDGDFMQEYRAIMKDNIKQKKLNPNGDSFGHGRVLKNFSEWIDI